ncbi:AsmA-like C-terminal region-containing protein [Tamlana sp. 2_MG-2023]|uniref:AsmA family protein n=1 Tax=unclassified Tamlana TaxID=2614803 RepID=UPI0026E293E7|nr:MULTISPECIES: AsmA family protein [unclassified Tamlana]MDO6760995.1 AsmA-like C-terminal region-containing protein [Tamlana sp. 2_MG-2023]MDO6791672.1 AsmA-like C-terminal region-containing protein [Tamlana sp. 1_MG-2023]
MKKILKIAGIILITIIIALIAIPFIFQGRIQELVKQTINKNINAHVEFSDVDLSFIRNFPEAGISVTDLVITNFEPFKDETLAIAKTISFTMSVKEVFKSADEAMVINSIYIDEALITLKTDKFGNSNYDIAKESEDVNASAEEQPSNFAFSIKDYQIKNSAFTYIDELSNTTAHISEFNHEGHGTFTSEVSELDTETALNLSVTIDSTNYLNNNPIKLDALIGVDLNNNKYTFKENKAQINQLPIHFDGFVQLLDEGQNIDITFENPESDFKNFLALIPETYSKSIENVETTGDFIVKGMVKGQLTETTIPTFDVSITSNDASFKYPDLPKAVKHISIHTLIKNTTGNADDTYVDINRLDFQIDQDVFKASAHLKNLTQNMLVDANINGVLNLANISKAYPVDLDQNLSGILKAKVNTAFDMNAIDTNAYERIKSNGSVDLTGFEMTSEDFVKPIQISQANLTFNPGTVSLNQFKAKTGETDLNATGTINNLLGFVFSDQTLKGNFDLNSYLFKVNDFMSETQEETEQSTETTTTTEAIKIPAFLDCTINAKANMVVYDNLNLEDVTGTLIIKDEQVTLQNVSSRIFNGKLGLSGNVSTKTEVPSFNMALDADSFDIAQSFKDLELLRSLAPIAQIFQGKLNTNINISGDLNNNFTPKLNSLTGQALAELLSTQINKDENGLISKLDNAVDFIDFEDININDIKTKLEFANGKVSVSPFDLNYKDIDITVTGAHGFDKTIDYSAVFNVPAKYLGSDINRLIGKIDDSKVDNMSIPITANITGSYTSPNVKTDLTSAAKNLSNQLLEIQKEKLLNQGKDEINNLIGDVIGGNKTKSDSLKQDQSKHVEDVLNGLIGSKENTDTTSNKTNDSKKVIKNVLDGFLGGKKKE